MKIFFDSNVAIAALTFPGVCSRVLHSAINGHEMFVSGYVLEEVEKTLRAKFPLTEAEITRRVSWLRKNSTVVPVPSLLNVPLRDPTDIPILSAAVAAHVDILVSGDKDLLELPNPPVRILSPRALHDMIVPSPS